MWPISFHKILEQLTYNPKNPLLFSSGLFLVLFVLFMAVYACLQKNHRAKATFVTLFSLFFYYKSSGIYFLILIFSTVVDYGLANMIYHETSKARKQLILIFSLVLNLGILVYFKYTNFFYEVYSNIAGNEFTAFDIILPVGVSFFTFQSLSYTMDIYRGTLKPVKNILDYAFFVSFFPQLVAGPIVRAADFIPQLLKPVVITKEMQGRALFLIMAGLIKKIVIADYISVNFVDRIFDNPALYTGLENLMAIYGYTLQIYCDFSGYSDMAIGIALLMGYTFNINFNSPYQSQNITEFWRRWHISLSTWLKDYLYISLGGNRKGKIRTYFNLFITMVLGGLWHGAGFRFLIWGAMHGAALGVHKLWLEVFPPKNDSTNPWLFKFLAGFFTFHFVAFCWIFFRANSLHAAGQVIGQILNHFSAKIWWQLLQGYSSVWWLMLLGYILHFIPTKTETYTLNIITKMPLWTKAVAMIAVIWLVVQFQQADVQPFIYFQF